MKMKFLILIGFCMAIFSSSAMGLDNNPLVVVNKDSPDAPYAKLIMDELYLHKKIQVVDDKITINENIHYNIPANNSFEIENSGERLYVEFKRDKDTINGIKYHKVEYIEKLDGNDEILFLGKSYKILKHTNDEIVLTDEVKNISTNNSFEYKNYKVILKAVSFDGSELLLDILKDGNPLENNVKINKGELMDIANSDISIYYENLSEHGKGHIFSFKIYNTVKLIDNEDFKLNNSFEVNIDSNGIILNYKNPENLQKAFNIFNYSIKLVNTTEGLTYFDVFYKNNYEINKEDIDETKYLGDNIFAVRKGDKLYLYKDGKEYTNITDYFVPDVVLDSNILNTDSDLILIGGPVSNNITKKIENNLEIPITNENPGKNREVIQIIKNPYNPDYKIMVIAGSDRNGTKACVLALLNGMYKNEETMIVELENNENVKVIKKL